MAKNASDNQLSDRSADGTTATVDEALEQTNFGKFNYLVIIFSGLVLKNVVLESVGISFALPVLDCDLELSYRQQGVLGAICFVGIIASSHLWGFLADTTGRRNIMRPALLLGFFVTIASSFSPNFETLVVLRFLSGILLSASSATVYAYLGEFHCQKYRNRAILSAALISAFSAIFFPVIAWVFINRDWQLPVPFLGIIYKPWRSYLLACGVPGFVCGLILHFFLPESPKYLLATGRKEEALRVVKSIYERNTRSNSKLRNTEFQVTSLVPDLDTPAPIKTMNDVLRPSRNAFVTLCRSMWVQTAPLFMRQHIRKTILSSFLQFIIFFTAHGVYMWFPYILNSSMQYTQQHAGLNDKCLCDILEFTQATNFTFQEPVDDTVVVEETCSTQLEISTYHHTIVLELIYVALLLCVIYAIGKFGRKPILFTILLVCGVCGILSLIIKIPLIAIYLFVILLCCGLGITVVNAIVVDIYPTNLRAMAVCISLMMGRIGSVTGSNVLGALIETHCQLALYTSACSLILAGFLGCLLPKSSTPLPPPQKKPNENHDSL